jgi:hypothetical protein
MQLQSRQSYQNIVVAAVLSLSWTLRLVEAYPGEVRLNGVPGDTSSACVALQQYQLRTQYGNVINKDRL